MEENTVSTIIGNTATSVIVDKKTTESSHRSYSNIYNESTKQAQLLHEIVNSAMNWKVITDACKAGRARDLADEPVVKNTPAIIVGSGYSLDLTAPYLKDWKGGIFCTTSHAVTLMYYGVEPTHIVALDPFSMWDEIKEIDWSKTKTKLITTPSVYPDIIEKWPNEMLLYLQNMGKPDSFYQSIQKPMYSHREVPEGSNIRFPVFHFYIRTELTLFACSPPVQLFAADKLGYGPLFLCGMDFGSPVTQGRFTRYAPNTDKWDTQLLETQGKELVEELKNDPTTDTSVFWDRFDAHFHNTEIKKVEWVKIKDQTVTDYFPGREDVIISNNGMKTRPIHLYYKKNFYSAWRLSHVSLYTTGKGICTEIPFTDIKKLVRTQGLDSHYKKQHPEWINKVCDRYLASVGTYVIETSGGVSFVENDNPLNDLPRFMTSIKQQYNCDKCGAPWNAMGYAEEMMGVINMVKAHGMKEEVIKACGQEFENARNGVIVNTDYTGQLCKNCKEGKLVHPVQIDVEANMTRIKRLIELTQ